jgi:hypothetical protein
MMAIGIGIMFIGLAKTMIGSSGRALHKADDPATAAPGSSRK